MAVTQDIEARYIPGKSGEINFTITGEVDEAAAETALRASELFPALFNGIPRDLIAIDTEHMDTLNPSQHIFRARVTFLRPLADDMGNVISFDTTGGTQHVTQSLATVGAYPNGSPNLGGAIGYDGENVQGTDIVVPAYEWTERHEFTKSQVSEKFRNMLAGYTSGINSNKFRGFPAGEVQYLGATGDMSIEGGATKWVLNFKFKQSPNRANFFVGDIEVREKAGWDYTWTFYGDTISNGRLVKVPKHVYVERMHGFFDFSVLGI